MECFISQAFIGFTNLSVGSVIAEQYTYVPYISLFFTGCLLDNLPGNYGKLCGACTCYNYFFQCYLLQAKTWKSRETLWDNVIKISLAQEHRCKSHSFRDANKLKAEADQAQNAKREQEANLKYTSEQNYQRAINYYTEAVKIN